MLNRLFFFLNKTSSIHFNMYKAKSLLLSIGLFLTLIFIGSTIHAQTTNNSTNDEAFSKKVLISEGQLTRLWFSR